MEAQIKSVDMTEDMQQEAIALAIEAMEKYHIEKVADIDFPQDIAQYIKKEFDSRKGATWHCIVGRNFGSFVTHALYLLLPRTLRHPPFQDPVKGNQRQEEQIREHPPRKASQNTISSDPFDLCLTTLVFLSLFTQRFLKGSSRACSRATSRCAPTVIIANIGMDIALPDGMYYIYRSSRTHKLTILRRPFFTICFIPVIPLAFHKYKEVLCYTCRVSQDLRDRPDITPETRPPPHMAWGPQPPPQAYGGYQQPPPQQQHMDYK
ncbi:hypothetical protein VI817_005169 [Penicillium citrinum]|nr:hypothetical protein VI817_005169 [Penicillium citrinum]